MLRKTPPRDDLATHVGYLRRYAVRKVGDPDVAADLVQDTLVSAMRAQSGFRGGSSLRTWLVAILKHKILDEFRRRIHAEVSLESLTEPDERDFMETGMSDDSVSSLGWHIDVGTPEDALATAQFWGAVQKRLQGLSTKAAQTFILADILGHSTEEVCDMLKMSPASVWTTMHRVRRVMRAEFAD